MAAKPKILVVEDEKDLRDIIIYNLNRDGFKSVGAGTGEKAIKKILKLKPDLIILDLMLPGMNGLDVCRQVKQDPSTQDIPIIIVSAKGDEADIVTGLELGADDYIPKPFSPRILLARVSAILRRLKQSDSKKQSKIIIEGLTIDIKKFQLRSDGQPIDLTKNEFGILYLLASHPGWVFTRDQIMDAIHGDKYVVTERAIDVQITGLRKKLGGYAALIETVRGVGYRLKE